MTRRAWLLFIAMSLLWGTPYLFIKIAVVELDPTFMVFARLAMAAFILLPLGIARKALNVTRQHAPILLAIAVFGIALPFFLIAYGERYVTSSFAALLIAADPLFIVVLALKVDQSERASGWRLLGLVIGFIGVAALVGLSLSGDPLEALGAAMVLGAALCYAISALLFKRLPGVSPIGATAITLTTASLVLLPFAALNVPRTMPSPPVLGSLIALGLVCTALAYVIYYSLIVEAGATRAALITYVNPAVAVILGVIILSEPVTVGTVVGFVLIIVGCAMSTSRTPPRYVSAFWRPVPSSNAWRR
jgi:drug/metabolite transporter (DMT)-like permease